MGYTLKVYVDTEYVGDLIINLLEVEDIEAEIERKEMAPPDEKKEHPYYSLFPPDLTIPILVTIPATITSLTGLAKVILDYKLKASKKKAKSKHADDSPVIVIDGEIIPLSKFSTVEELSKYLEEKTKKGKTEIPKKSRKSSRQK